MTDRQGSLFDAAPDLFLPISLPAGEALDVSADLPPGPFRPSLCSDLETGGWCPPFTVRAGNGRAICALIPSLSIARAIAAALNAAHPVSE